jgi:uncharacterized membrane protein
MPRIRLSALPAWPVVMGALIYGWIEWIALTRSRAADAVQEARRVFRV